MLVKKQFSAVLGFAFIAAWIAFGFGNAVLCLLGGAVAYGAAAVLEGEIDLGDLQARLRGQDVASSPLAPPPVPPVPVPRRAPRVR